MSMSLGPDRGAETPPWQQEWDEGVGEIGEGARALAERLGELDQSDQFKVYDALNKTGLAPQVFKWVETGEQASEAIQLVDAVLAADKESLKSARETLDRFLRDV